MAHATHTQVANTPATVQHALVHAMVSINHATHTHTKGRGPWIDGQSGIHNMPLLRERRERLDGGQWTCERGQATCNTTGQKEAPLKPCSHHSSLHQQPPHHHTHHTSVVMVTHCLLTHSHTRGPRQDKEHTTTKPMVWMACTVTMVWHKRGCGVVLPSSLVQHVVAPTPSKWPRAHHTALQPPQHPCFLVSTHVPQPVHTHPHVCVCDCGTEPSTMPTSVVINHCVPCQSTTWSFIHHQSPPPAAAAQEQESVVTQMDEGMEAHTTHSVVESNTANQHTSTHTSGHTNTSQPPIHHTHTGWMAKGLIARTCEESEKTTPCK